MRRSKPREASDSQTWGIATRVFRLYFFCSSSFDAVAVVAAAALQAIGRQGPRTARKKGAAARGNEMRQTVADVTGQGAVRWYVGDCYLR